MNAIYLPSFHNVGYQLLIEIYAVVPDFDKTYILMNSPNPY